MRLSTCILASISLAIAASPAAAQKPMSGDRMHVDVAIPTLSPELVFEPIAACRVFDTHKSSALNAPRAFTISGTANLKGQGGPKGGCGVPLSATAVAISFGTSDASKSGTIAAYPSGRPATNNIAAAFAPSLQMAAGAVVGLNNHQLTLSPSVGAVQVTADVTGYYAPQIEGYMNSDGSLYSNTTRILSVVHIGTGYYQITVDRDIGSCSASLVSGYNTILVQGYAVVDYISIHTFNVASGTPVAQDAAVNFSVQC